jgi:hypothetical protein
LWSGRSFELFNRIELGPTGARLYWQLPDSLPGGAFDRLAWNVELLNVRLNRQHDMASEAQLGLSMDTELRLRIGRAHLEPMDSLLAGEKAFTIGIEVASGYSVFLWEKD